MLEGVSTVTICSNLTKQFRIASAADFLGLERLARHQQFRDVAHWFEPDRPPLCVLFVSHRWEASDHPDPQARQLRALQKLARLIARWVGVAFLRKSERDLFMPDLAIEGSLQALTIALRILDLEPMEAAPMPGQLRRAEIDRMAGDLGPRSDAFAAWLATRIGVWIDYCSVPQAPRSDNERRQLQTTLRQLDTLIDSATLVALRFGGDQYAGRAWCVAETLVSAKDAGGRGFGRNVFVDLDALAGDRPLYMPERAASPLVPDAKAVRVMQETYEQATRGFTQDRARVLAEEHPFVQIRPPRLWSAYQDVLSSSFHPRDADPNPVRAALEFMLGFEETLVREWLFALLPVELDIATLVEETMKRAGLGCTAPEDLAYLGLLVARRGRLAEIKHLVEACFVRYVDHALGRGVRTLRVRLHPTSQAARDLLTRARPCSPGVWRSRLTTGALGAERDLVAQLRAELERAPLTFDFQDPQAAVLDR